MILIIILHTLYGCTFTISKILISYTSPIFIIGFRMIIAGTLLLSYSSWHSSKKYCNKLDLKSLFYLIQMGTIGTCLPYVLRYWSLKYLPVTKIALLYNLSPFASFLFSFIFFNEEITFRKWISLAIGFSSIIPIIFAKTGSVEAGSFSFGFLSLPEIAMIVAVIGYAYGWVVMKKLVLYSNLSPYRINGINMLMAGFLALLISFFFEKSFPTELPSSLYFWLWLCIIILITNIICNNIYTLLLKKYTITLLSIAGLISPISAALTSFLYFGEAITWDYVLAGCLVFTGFILFYSEEFKSI